MPNPIDPSAGRKLKKYDEEYLGTVEEVTGDPQRGLKIRVRVHPVFDGVSVQDLPFAVYKLPVGCRPNDGVFFPVQVGDKVWCDFPFDGDTRRPRITGSVHESPGGKPNVPAEAFGGDGKVVVKRQGGEPAAEEPKYHEDVVLKQHGVLVHISKSGAIRLVHEASGSNFEITSTGEIVAHTEKKAFSYAKDGAEAVYDAKSTVKAPQSELTIDKTTHIGDVTILGNLEIAGDADGGIGEEKKKANTEHTGSYQLHGPMEIDQALTVNADSTINGVLTVAGLSFSGGGGEGGGGGSIGEALAAATAAAEESAQEAAGAAQTALDAVAQVGGVVDEVTSLGQQALGYAGQAQAAATAAQAVVSEVTALSGVASTSAGTAAAAATTAITSKDNAQAASTTATAAASVATAKATEATNAVTAAQVQVATAQAHADTATQKASDAQTASVASAGSATAAQTAQGAAEAAKAGAETAKAGAETARDAANTAKMDAQAAVGVAQGAATAANGSATAANTAKTEAEAARDLAEIYRDEALAATPGGSTANVPSGAVIAQHLMCNGF